MPPAIESRHLRLGPTSTAGTPLPRAVAHPRVLSAVCRSQQELIRLQEEWRVRCSRRWALRVLSTTLGMLVGCLPTPHEGLNHASDLFTSGRYEDAAREYQRVIDMRPSWAPPYLGLGNARWALNQRPGALQAYRQAVALSPDWVDASNSLAKALIEMDQSSAAVPVLTHALQIDPDNAWSKSLLDQARHRAAGKRP